MNLETSCVRGCSFRELCIVFFTNNLETCTFSTVYNYYDIVMHYSLNLDRISEAEGKIISTRRNHVHG